MRGVLLDAARVAPAPSSHLETLVSAAEPGRPPPKTSVAQVPSCLIFALEVPALFPPPCASPALSSLWAWSFRSPALSWPALRRSSPVLLPIFIPRSLVQSAIPHSLSIFSWLFYHLHFFYCLPFLWDKTRRTVACFCLLFCLFSTLSRLVLRSTRPIHSTRPGPSRLSSFAKINHDHQRPLHAVDTRRNPHIRRL